MAQEVKNYVLLDKNQILVPMYHDKDDVEVGKTVYLQVSTSIMKGKVKKRLNKSDHYEVTTMFNGKEKPFFKRKSEIMAIGLKTYV